MDAINLQLKQLEDVEVTVYIQRQATLHRRSEEDRALQLKRQEEDEDYLGILGDQDREEDVSVSAYLHQN